jgi:hypothetical protein
MARAYLKSKITDRVKGTKGKRAADRGDSRAGAATHSGVDRDPDARLFVGPRSGRITTAGAQLDADVNGILQMSDRGVVIDSRPR